MYVFASSRMDSLAVESRLWKKDLGGDFCMEVLAVHRGDARVWKDLILSFGISASLAHRCMYSVHVHVLHVS